jgi:S-adenosylmethionine hydrolase
VSRPIVLCTDYGLSDEFVGICHGVIERIAPGARVIDLTHAIPRQDVFRGAVVLSRAAAYMPPDAVYCAVVDPGVGSERRAIAVLAASGALLVGPDNGLLSPAWEALGGIDAVHEIVSGSVVLLPVSRTFHGRDVFSPAAAHLASGVPIERVGPGLDPQDLRSIELPGPMVAPGAVGGRVTGVDGFGNVQLNVTTEHLASAGIGDRLAMGSARIPLVGIFADLPEHGLGAIVDSQGYLALVVNKGSAADALRLQEGAAVVLESGDDAPPSRGHLQSVR